MTATVESSFVIAPRYDGQGNISLQTRENRGIEIGSTVYENFQAYVEECAKQTYPVLDASVYEFSVTNITMRLRTGRVVVDVTYNGFVSLATIELNAVTTEARQDIVLPAPAKLPIGTSLEFTITDLDDPSGDFCIAYGITRS